MVAGPNAVDYVKHLKKHAEDLPQEIYDARVKEEQAKWDAIMKMEGTENAYLLHKELGEMMTATMTVVRYNDQLEDTLKNLMSLLSVGTTSTSMIRKMEQSRRTLYTSA